MVLGSNSRTGEGRQPVQRVSMKMVLPLLRVPRPPSHWDTAQTHPSKWQRSANFVGTCTCLLKDTLKCFALGKDLRDPLDQLLFTDEETEAQQVQVIWPRLCVC